MNYPAASCEVSKPNFSNGIAASSEKLNLLRLKDIRELSAFVGLVPTEHSTGDDVNHGSITHLGNSVLRSLLIEAAWSAICKDKELNQSFDTTV